MHTELASSAKPAKAKYTYFKLRGNSKQRGQQAAATIRQFPSAQRGAMKNSRFVADKPSSPVRGTVLRIAVAK